MNFPVFLFQRNISTAHEDAQRSLDDIHEDMCSVLPTSLAATIAVSVEAHKRWGKRAEPRFRRRKRQRYGYSVVPSWFILNEVAPRGT